MTKKYHAKDHTDRDINFLVGRTIVGVRHMQKDEIEMFGWYASPESTTILQLDDDSLVIVLSDPEGNDAGHLLVQKGNQ